MLGKMRSIEYRYIEPGSYHTRLDFRNSVLEEVADLQRHKYTWALKENVDAEDVPTPILIYILFKDFGAAKTMLCPKSKLEQQIMIIAIKKQLQSFTVQGEVKEIDLVAWASETTMCSIDMKDDPEFKSLSEAEITKKYKELFDAGKLPVKDNVVVSFEENKTFHREALVYNVVAGELVEAIEETKVMNKGGAKGTSEGLMVSLLNYSKDEEINILGTDASTQIAYFDLADAVKYIQDVLAKIRSHSKRTD